MVCNHHYKYVARCKRSAFWSHPEKGHNKETTKSNKTLSVFLSSLTCLANRTSQLHRREKSWIRRLAALLATREAPVNPTQSLEACWESR